MQAVIVAGGEGVRLRPFTYAIPKPLLPVGDTTILDHTLTLLKQSGFTHVIIVINYLSEQFLDFFHNRESNDADHFAISMYHEKKKLGTAGALSLIRDQLHEDFCVINGDLLFRAPLDQLMQCHRDSASAITIGTKRYADHIPYAVIASDPHHRLTDIVEKPTYYHTINTGIYAMNTTVLERLPHDTYFDMPSVIQSLLHDRHTVSTFDIGSQWYDMGHLVDYERAMDIIAQWKK